MVLAMSHQFFDSDASFYHVGKSNAWWHLHLSITMDQGSLQERIDGIDDLVLHFCRYGRVDFRIVTEWCREEAHAYAQSLGRLMKAEHPSETLTST